MRRPLTLKLFVFLAFIGTVLFQYCSRDIDQVVDHEYDSSCVSCHSDQAALLALATPDETNGESSGEG